MSFRNEVKLHSRYSFDGAGEQTKPVENEEEVFSCEKVFRGFEKKPVVLLERFNILPFLNNKQVKHKKNGTYIGNNSLKLAFSKLSHNCSVVLVRKDLEKLKKDLIDKKSNSNTRSLKDISVLNLTCNTCKKSFKSLKRLRTHQAKKHNKVDRPQNQPQKRVSFSDHVIIHEVEDYHRCKECTKIFKDYELLKIHITQNHGKTSPFICNFCSKKFMDRGNFKTHIKLHCPLCGFFLANKSLSFEHRRICRNTKLYNCKTCGDNYFKFMDLKDHSYEHITTCYVCDICKDQFETKCATAHHIAFLHSNSCPRELYDTCNLGSDRLYICNFCNESTAEKESMDSHLSELPDLSNHAMTGYKDYYFCDQCLKKFETESNMLKHKWSHFLKTGDNSQLRKNNTKTVKTKKLVYKLYKGDKPMPVKEKSNAVEDIKTSNDNKSNMQKEDKSKNGLLPMSLINGEADSRAVKNSGQTNISNTQEQTSSYEIPNTEIIFKSKPINPEQSLCNQIPNRQSPSFDTVDIDYTNPPKKPLVDPRSKKTIISRFNCELCGKYYSTNYTLVRHKSAVHCRKDNLSCNICGETFICTKFLQMHECIGVNISEMSNVDWSPQFTDNLGMRPPFVDLNHYNDHYMAGVDFEVPAPIVELTEYDHQMVTEPTPEQILPIVNDLRACMLPLQNLGYKIVMQEVPIEF